MAGPGTEGTALRPAPSVPRPLDGRGGRPHAHTLDADSATLVERNRLTATRTNPRPSSTRWRFSPNRVAPFGRSAWRF